MVAQSSSDFSFFIVIVSILSILVVFRPQSPVNLHNEGFLIENPRNCSSRKLSGELQSPLLKIILSQLQKKWKQICLKSLLQRLGKLLVDVKLKTFEKDVGTKIVRKQLGCEKKMQP